MHLTDGVLRRLTWPEIELRAATDADGRELLLLVGDEPDRLWHRFTDEVVTLALDFGVRMCVGLGAYPFAAPHTRPPRVACTASTPQLAEGSFLRASLDFAGGIQAAIEQACHDRGIPSLGVWAQIPHYLPTRMPFPAGSQALIESVNLVGDLNLPLGDLAARAEATPRPARRADRARTPSTARCCAGSRRRGTRPSRSTSRWRSATCRAGDELVAELEEFLRDQRPD